MDSVEQRAFAEELGIAADASLDAVLDAYIRELKGWQAKVTAEPDKTARKMLKSEFNAWREQFTVLDTEWARRELETLVGEISGLLNDGLGHGALVEYFEQAETLAAKLPQDGLTRKLRALRTASQERIQPKDEAGNGGGQDSSATVPCGAADSAAGRREGGKTDHLFIPADEVADKPVSTVKRLPGGDLPLLPSCLRMRTDAGEIILCCESQVLFGRETRFGNHVGLMEMQGEQDSEQFAMISKEISRKHFMLLWQGGVLNLVDGAFEEGGQRPSLGGIYLNQQRVYLQRLERIADGTVLTVRHPEVVEGYPAFSLAMIGGSVPELEVLEKLVKQGHGLLEGKSLCLRRIEGPGQVVVCAWGALAGGEIDPALGGLTFMPTANGFIVSQADGGWLNVAMLEKLNGVFGA